MMQYVTHIERILLHMVFHIQLTEQKISMVSGVGGVMGGWGWREKHPFVIKNMLCSDQTHGPVTEAAKSRELCRKNGDVHLKNAGGEKWLEVETHWQKYAGN